MYRQTSTDHGQPKRMEYLVEQLDAVTAIQIRHLDTIQFCICPVESLDFVVDAKTVRPGLKRNKKTVKRCHHKYNGM